MQSITWFKQTRFTEKMSVSWSIATFQQQRKKMSLYEFKVEMEFSGYNTDRPEMVEKFYKIYSDKLDELQKQISK